MRTPIFIVAILLAAPLSAWAFAGSNPAPAAVPLTYSNYAGPSDVTVFPDQFGLFILGGEPSLGINHNTGAVMYQHGFETFNVDLSESDETSQWDQVTPAWTQFNVDPMLFTDATTGRTFAGGLDGACSIMGYSDDDGTTWTPMGNPCVATLDHQTIASGPWRSNRVQPPTSEFAVYYCAQAQFVTCATSYDGGITFAPSTPVPCGYSNPGFHGSVHVGPQGRVYLPFRNCSSSTVEATGVAYSDDNGLNWNFEQVPDTTIPDNGFDSDVATTPNRDLWLAWQDGDDHIKVTKSAISGALGPSFTNAKYDLSAMAGLAQSTFPEVVAGDDGRVAVAFLGSTTPGDGFQDGYTGVWHLYIGTTYDDGATWEVHQATDDPVQRGWICNNGTGCSTGRNLLDFMDAQIDEKGRILVGYADGCIGACATATGTIAQSTASSAAITRQASGKTLFAAFDNAATALTVSTGAAVSGDVNTAIAIGGAAGGGSEPYTYAWSIDAAPLGGSGTFASTTSAATTFTPDTVGAYTLRLSVTDSNADTASATLGLTAIATGGGGNNTGGGNDDLSTGRVLWFVGTGSTGVPFVVQGQLPTLSASGNGGVRSTHATTGTWAMTSPNNGGLASLAYDGDVYLSGGTVQVHVYATQETAYDELGNPCSAGATLFDGSGQLLGEGEADLIGAHGTTKHAIIEIAPIAGRHTDLTVQVGTPYVDCSPIVLVWGDADAPAHILMADGDRGGGEY